MTEKFKAELIAFVEGAGVQDVCNIYAVNGACYLVPVRGNDVFVNETLHIANAVPEQMDIIDAVEVLPTYKFVSSKVREAIRLESRLWYDDLNDALPTVIHTEPVRKPKKLLNWFKTVQYNARRAAPQRRTPQYLGLSAS